jgi:methylated-DNA-protein-cysteine methyltransferase-like protein
MYDKGKKKRPVFLLDFYVALAYTPNQSGKPVFLSYRRRRDSRNKRLCSEEKTMAKILDDKLIYEILSVVGEIPEGKVASYGQIAQLIGRDRNSRLVGKVLSMAEFYGDYPCHRVVNHAGRLAPHFREQRERLTAEGVVFKANGCVDMEKCRWA